jgi:signal peptidase I
LAQTEPRIARLLVCFGFFRSAAGDWNAIPSGSMRPTLLEGDVVLIDRLAYDVKVPWTDISLFGIAEPRRGDIVTFTSPADGHRLIKRLVAVPGDVVEMRDEQLIIDGQAAVYVGRSQAIETTDLGATERRVSLERAGTSERTVQFLPELRVMRSFGPVVVPKGRCFFLGDNRDNSADSRYIGTVPREQLIGAHITSSYPRTSRPTGCRASIDSRCGCAEFVAH